MDTNFQTNNRPVLKAIVILIAVFLALAVVEKAITLAKTISPSKPDNTISMTAEGKVTGKPDLATVSLGVLTQADTAKGASDENNKSINKIAEAVKKLGIANEDIVTSNLNVYPNYTYTNGKNEINGYQANQNLTIKIHGVDKSTDTLNKVLDAAVSSGSNQIQGVGLSFDDPDNLKQEARKQAIDKAKQKAKELADQAGLRLGRIVSISESSGYDTPIPYMMDSKAGMGGGGSAPAVETGSQDITASITVVFEVK